MKRISTIVARTISVLVLCSSIFLGGCIESPYFQKQVSIPSYQWEYKYMPSFEFEVTDTTSLYNVYFIMRHTDAFPYANLWMNIYTKQPGDTTFSKQRVNAELATSSGPNAGQWLGRGMGEIWEHKLLITHEGDSTILQKKGKYTIKFEQNMRINPLPEILQVGLRVEKGKPRNFGAQ